MKSVLHMTWPYKILEPFIGEEKKEIDREILFINFKRLRILIYIIISVISLILISSIVFALRDPVYMAGVKTNIFSFSLISVLAAVYFCIRPKSTIEIKWYHHTYLIVFIFSWMLWAGYSMGLEKVVVTGFEGFIVNVFLVALIFLLPYYAILTVYIASCSVLVISYVFHNPDLPVTHNTFFSLAPMILLGIIGNQILYISFLRSLVAERNTKKAYTELKELNEILDQKVRERTSELEQSKFKAEESDRLKSEFLANVSHEIRTPMNAIVGALQLIESGDLTKKEKEDFIVIGKNSADQLLRLITDIVDLSRMESGNFSLEYSSCNLKQLLQHIHTGFITQKKKLGKSKIKLSLAYNLLSQESEILTDSNRLRQILDNLVSNALKFTHTGTIEIGCNKSDKNDFLQFYVKDTGIGISAESKQVIFERFRQGSIYAEDKTAGAGLGLSITKALIEQFGGTIWLESVPDQGTTFFFTIPYKSLLPGKVVSEKTPIAEDISLPPNVNILIVEDVDANFMTLNELLIRQKAKIVRAKDGFEAIEICKNQKIELVLMDIRLPNLDGLEATRRIKSIKPSLPVVAITAFAMPEDRKKCKEAGCDDYLSKPYQNFELLRKINLQLITK